MSTRSYFIQVSTIRSVSSDESIGYHMDEMLFRRSSRDAFNAESSKDHHLLDLECRLGLGNESRSPHLFNIAVSIISGQSTLLHRAHEDGNTQKMWVCLYTCLSTRAISVEPVMDCSSISFIDCLSHFISRRGTPQMMISDNAPQFRLAKTLFDRTWQQVLTDDSVRSYISTKGILWKFTTALVPWQGGFYERMVGVVKSTLKSAIGRRLLKFEEFTTLIAEVESIVNSLPLPYVHSDIDSGLALRPIDFLTGLATGTCEVDPNTKLEGGDAGKNLLRYWKTKQRRLDLLWRHFYDEYVTSLRERGQTSHRNRRSDIHSAPKINEVVLVKNPEASRGAWEVGKIRKLIPSRDGLIRSVELLLPNKMTIERSVAFIYPLVIPSKIR